MTKPNGGSAYPFMWWRSPDGMVAVNNTGGMSLRDYFAGQALMGLMHVPWIGSYTLEMRAGMRAIEAYGFADAMITEREK